MNKVVSVVIFLIVLSSLSVWLLYGRAKSDQTESQTDLFFEESELVSQDIQAELPAPGTYELYDIYPVPELSVLDSKGQKQPISKYTKGKITLLTFFYQRCNDVDGCPYAMSLFHRVKSKLDRDESLRDRMRFVHISFDPARDTPQMMAGLEKKYKELSKGKKAIEWNFLTTPSVEELLPVVDAFGQNVDIDVSTMTNEKTVSYSHVLKVFLIDEEGMVREIYSTTYISKEMLLNDIETLALEN